MSATKDAVRVTAILQARTTSSRLPGKVLADLAGAPMLLRQIERIGRARLIDKLVVATSTDASDDALSELLQRHDITVCRGSLDDVLDRFAAAARLAPSLHIVRLTGDCPLADPDVIDSVIAHHLVCGSDITSNSVEATFPDGLDVEVVRTSVLMEAAQNAKAKFEREHVTQYVYRRPERFRIIHYKQPNDLSHFRWTVDEPDDLEFVRAIYAELYPANPNFGMHDVVQLLTRKPDLVAVNARYERNEGLARSIAAEEKTATTIGKV